MLAIALMLALMLARPEPADAEVLATSCYGEELRGSPTASGVPFDPDAHTTAHLGYPFGTVLAVTSMDTGAMVYVTVNDRGPYVAGRGLDLSCGAMDGLLLAPGVYAVDVEVVSFAY